MKQTATNYLIDQLSLKAMAEHIPWVSKILDTAIEMEQEQIAEAFDHVDSNLDDGLHYYEETFNKPINNKG
jgi:hypothetical protein